MLITLHYNNNYSNNDNNIGIIGEQKRNISLKSHLFQYLIKL